MARTRDPHAAALKAWAARRGGARGSGSAMRKLYAQVRRGAAAGGGRAVISPSGKHAGILPSGQRGWGGGAGRGVGGQTLSPSMFPKVAGQVVNAMRQVREIGSAIRHGKRRAGGMADRGMHEWAEYANRMSRALAHTARKRGMVR